MSVQVDCERAVQWRADTPADDGDGLELSGYAAVFHEPSLINDAEGRYLEEIAPGAFRKTLNERGDRVALLLEHGRNPLLGTLPLGKITELREDDHGLFVRAKLHDNWLTQPVRDAIASGAIKDMSFRFRPIQQRVDRSGELPLVVRTEVSLIELGPVTIGAYSGTEVALRAWADAAPEEFRSVILHSAEQFGDKLPTPSEATVSVSTAVDPDEAVVAVEGMLRDTMTDESTLSPAGSTTGIEDRAATEDEPAHRATPHRLRQLALALRGTPE